MVAAAENIFEMLQYIYVLMTRVQFCVFKRGSLLFLANWQHQSTDISLTVSSGCARMNVLSL